jgi:ATP sulfurylase
MRETINAYLLSGMCRPECGHCNLDVTHMAFYCKKCKNIMYCSRKCEKKSKHKCDKSNHVSISAHQKTVRLTKLLIYYHVSMNHFSHPENLLSAGEYVHLVIVNDAQSLMKNYKLPDVQLVKYPENNKIFCKKPNVLDFCIKINDQIQLFHVRKPTHVLTGI